mmetsp:Transcript_85619/g.135830  ORF Transcript_85619/g.135830 Transcript_85619/m.135830 type:complete len:206 (+) Transcript_85619:416-1033(+)
MASSTRSMPPTSANALNPAQRFPTRLDMASMPVNWTKLSSMKRAIMLAAARIAPASTNAAGKSLTESIGERVLASANQPTPSPGFLHSCSHLVKPSAACFASITSLEESCSSSCGTISLQAASALHAARNRPQSAPGEPAGSCTGCSGGGPPPSLSGFTSAAMILAKASLALAPISFGSDLDAIDVNSCPMTSGCASLINATSWS